MWLNSRKTALVCTLACALLAIASTALAQTPLDTQIAGLSSSIRGVWAPMLIMVIGIVAALGALYALHAGPTVIMGIVVAFFVLAFIAAAVNGTLHGWLGVGFA